MAESKENVQMEKITSLCKRRGFIFQSSEIYGGINGFWDYGPLGAELKRNVKELWWNALVRRREDVAGLEAAIIMHPQIWKASGHVDTFADQMVEDPLTNKRFRADQVEPQTGIVYHFAGVVEQGEYLGRDMTGDEYVKIANNIKAPQLHALNGYPAEALPRLKAQELARMEKGGGAQAAKLLSQKGQWLPFSVLLPQEKASPEEARKKAMLFYQTKHRVLNPLLIGGTREEVVDSQDYSPDSGARLSYPRPFNLMFSSYAGPIESEENKVYLRPETAQAIFAQFKNVLETSRQKVPFGIAQIGKAFRNEVTPRNYTFRSREFEQMELEFFIPPDEAVEAIHGAVATVPATGHPGEPQPNWGWQAWHRYWVEERVRFYEDIGLTRETLGFHEQTPEELAHYARACTDILFKFPFSKRDEKGELKGEELEGIAARSDFDLSQHQRFSGRPMHVFDEELRNAWAKLPKEKQDDLWQRFYENRKRYLTKMGIKTEAAQKQATKDADMLARGNYIPHVIEPSAGVDRLILALIANAYTETVKTDAQGKSETLYVMKLHPRVAPVKAGIFPLLKNRPELVKKALEIRDLLRPWLNVFYDESGAIGRRYARQDEAGTPFCVTVDFDTLGEKPERPDWLDTVTLRHRDDGRQERVKISELRDWLLARVR